MLDSLTIPCQFHCKGTAHLGLFTLNEAPVVEKKRRTVVLQTRYAPLQPFHRLLKQ